MTRSRVIPETQRAVEADAVFSPSSSDDVKTEDDVFQESLATAPSESGSNNGEDVPPPIVTPVTRPLKRKIVSEISQETLPVTSDSVQQRKRGRHKEYTAPTGVWKTNGGYISTIYVGNKRIYGPLRESPVEAGYDRQKLIEAKTFVRNELEMRRFIVSLKTTSSPPPFVSSEQQQLPIKPTPTSRERRQRPELTTIQSGPMMIVSADPPAL